MIKNDIIFKQQEALDKRITKSTQEQIKLYEDITRNIPASFLDKKNICYVKSIFQLQNKINLIPNDKLEFIKIHKATFNYLNFHKDIVKSFPRFSQLYELNHNIQSLNLNLPYTQLKNTPGWDAYQRLNHIFNNFSPLIDSINKNFIMNNILINDSSIYSWLETLKTNREIMLSFNAFKNSDLGLELSSDLKSIEEKPHLTHRERQILFFIFIGFTISFQYPDLSLKIFQIAEDFFNELNNFKPLAAFGAYCTLKEIAQKFKSFIEDSQSFTNEIDF